ncbi:MAG: hypothetical protein HQK53_17000, partial [Oligoflexia bacterium]|nr:hypothetical protein [Oligoflexia bacterium]
MLMAKQKKIFMILFITLLNLIVSSTSFGASASDTSDTIERNNFIATIQLFENQHHTTIENLLMSEKAPEKIALQKEFFSIPEIRNYLTRNSSKVIFTDGHPLLISNKQDKMNSDYYEMEIYRSNIGGQIPYRFDANDRQFYTSGPPFSVSELATAEPEQDERIYTYDYNNIHNIRSIIDVTASGYSLYFPGNIPPAPQIRFLLFPMIK